MAFGDIEIKGYADLIKKLDKLEAKAGQKVVSNILSKSTTPLKAAWRAAAPVGTRWHRTYKRNIVAPGFLKKSITSRRKNRGLRKVVAMVIAGVKDEAFYGPQFLDEGISVTSRRKSGRAQYRKPVRPYRIGRRKWYASTFRKKEKSMIDDIAKQLERELRKV